MHLQGALCDLLNVVHLLDGSVGGLLIGEANEAEATATTSVTVFDDDLYRVITGISCGGVCVRHTASSTWPYCSNLARRALSSVCHARPLH